MSTRPTGGPLRFWRSRSANAFNVRLIGKMFGGCRSLMICVFRVWVGRLGPPRRTQESTIVLHARRQRVYSTPRFLDGSGRAAAWSGMIFHTCTAFGDETCRVRKDVVFDMTTIDTCCSGGPCLTASQMSCGIQKDKNHAQCGLQGDIIGAALRLTASH